MTMRPFTDARGGLNHLVDAQIGRAFPVVHKVYQHLDTIEYVAKVWEAGRARDIVLRTNHTKEWIEWQYKGEAKWTILFKFSDLLGADIADVVAAEAALAAELEQLRLQLNADMQTAVEAKNASVAAQAGAEAAKTTAQAAVADVDQKILVAAEHEAATSAAANQGAQHLADIEAQVVAAETLAQATEAAASSAQDASIAASSSAQAAEVSAQTAVDSVVAADGSADAAGVSAVAAADSAAEALGHKTGAGIARDAADASATAAAQAEAGALGAAGNATLSASGADISAQAAQDSADAAAASALAASQSEQAAATSASEAADSAVIVAAQMVGIDAKLDAADALVVSMEQLRDQTLVYKNAAQDSTTNAQIVLDARVVVEGMANTIATQHTEISGFSATATAAATTATTARDEAVSANTTVSANVLLVDAAKTSAEAAALAAEGSKDAAALSESNAKASENLASASATSATASATAASGSAIAADTSASQAASSASSAATSADTATTKAGEASTSATAAATSAGTATTKAGEAVASALAAADSASTATTKASEAGASANNASDSANTATTKAGEAVASASSASASAATAATKASEASSAAASALASADTATAKASEAASSAASAASALNTKVDKVAGKQLSTEDFTSAEKAKLSGIASGAQVNTATQAALDGKEPTIAAGTATQYWRGDKTWRDFFTDVRAATLTGLSTATNAVVLATDTVLAAIGKLQAQVSAKFDKTGGDVDGNINFTGTGRRITGDFSNVTVANRGMVQTNVLNGTTLLRAIPNGSSSTAGYQAGNSSDPANQSTVSLLADPNRVAVVSGSNGAGSVLPLVLDVSGERLRIDPTTGNVGIGTSAPANKFVVSEAGAQGLEILPNTAGVTWISSFNRATASATPLALQSSSLIFNAPSATFAGVFGYGVGAGGTVVQATSKSTSVTLNKPSGLIVLNPSPLAAGATVAFEFNNSLLSDIDTVAVSFFGSVGSVQLNYSIRISTAAGKAAISVRNDSAGTLSEAVALTFKIFKGSIS